MGDVMATGTVTISEPDHLMVKKVSFEWTSTTGGSAGDTTTKSCDGHVYRVIVDPGSSNSMPSSGYDIAVNDSDGYDIFDGLLANSSSGTTVQYGVSTGGSVLTPLTTVASRLTLAVTNAGDTKSGKVILYIR